MDIVIIHILDLMILTSRFQLVCSTILCHIRQITFSIVNYFHHHLKSTAVAWEPRTGQASLETDTRKVQNKQAALTSNDPCRL